ncbi:hypothetical protein EC991_008885 [Linnemannia zychae]|nr:hypothetical protein EC991_008885 [Linnemannia zychae]
MSQFSQVSNVSFAGIAHSTPREEPSQLSTPSNPSPGDSQISPLGTYSTAAGSQQYPTQDTQGPVRSPTINAQLSRQGIAQKINVVMYTRVTETATAVEHDDNATQPLDLFGPDPRPDDVEASFEEEEVSYTQGSSGPAPRNFAADDENAEVDEITSQDINSPFEATPSPAKPKGRTEDGDGEDVRGPAHVEYLSSDDDDASKLSVHDSTIHLHLTQDLSASNSSFPIQSLTRSRPASRTDADKILPPSTTRHGKLPESSQHLEEPIITQKPLDSQQPDDSSLPPSQTSLVEEPFTTSKRKPRSARSPRPSASQLEDVPSSQNSGSSLTGSSSYSRRMRPLEEEFKAELKADPKRRRVLSSDKPTDVPSSVEDEFWESSVTESQAKVTVIQEKRVSRTRSRPISQDTSSFPSGQLSQAENEDQPGLTDKGKSKAAEKDDTVWARWLKGRYWAGVIQDKIDNKYNVLFLDRNELDCEADELRPLKLQLGTEVMARKTAKKEYPAILEGVHTMREFAQSRLDIRFEDKTEANVALGEIYLTQEMMDKLDDHIDWDMDNLRAITGEQSSQSESIPSEPSTPRRSSSTSVPPSTPRKGKDRSELARYGSAAPLTPRRGRSEAVSSAEIITPTGSGKDEGIKKKIVEGAGSIAEKFPQVIGRHPSDLQSNVVLISYTHLRSPKYFDALAMNVPRLSYRWVESCIKNHQLQSPQHYKLATGFSKELETVVSTEPVNDFGIFDGLEIGICGGTTAFMKDCKNRLKAAGAAVVKVTPEKGPMSCNFVVFSDTQQYTAYCKENTDIPPLSREWLYQCLINQRIMGINGHPSYTELEEVYQPETP